MHSKNTISRELLQQAFVQHDFSAGAPFFSGLKNKMDRPTFRRIKRQYCGSSQKHGCMTIMPARMHTPNMTGNMSMIAPLLYWQGVHIRAKKD
ncbi:hypothetical protein AA106556_1072 [Neokomagataea tanensis NBRC 106556]|uniref:Transposase n=1 Tax=Neokomagataea tanensis NBRC 106556 TaxID=1223519 RepID=A0ABQ0QIZ6_9PROT|nr:hypothetical protein AA106556_1072 [Neokomagataea tanensis NBRC 106556]